MLTGGIPPCKRGCHPTRHNMPNVVSTLSREDHASLKKRAKKNRRSIGSQLAFEAFAFLGLQAPAYLSPDAAKPVKKGAKA